MKDSILMILINEVFKISTVSRALYKSTWFRIHRKYLEILNSKIWEISSHTKPHISLKNNKYANSFNPYSIFSVWHVAKETISFVLFYPSRRLRTSTYHFYQLVFLVGWRRNGSCPKKVQTVSQLSSRTRFLMTIVVKPLKLLASEINPEWQMGCFCYFDTAW